MEGLGNLGYSGPARSAILYIYIQYSRPARSAARHGPPPGTVRHQNEWLVLLVSPFSQSFQWVLVVRTRPRHTDRQTLSIDVSVYLSFCLSIYLSICLFVCLSVWGASRPATLSICLLFLSICLGRVPARHSVCLSVMRWITCYMALSDKLFREKLYRTLSDKLLRE